MRSDLQEIPCKNKAWKDGYCKIHHPKERSRKQSERYNRKEQLWKNAQEKQTKQAKIIKSIMNTNKNELDTQGNGIMSDVISRFASDNFIDNVCLSYRHDFGLMVEQDKQRMRLECKEWMRSIENNWKYF